MAEGVQGKKKRETFAVAYDPSRVHRKEIRDDQNDKMSEMRG